MQKLSRLISKDVKERSAMEWEINPAAGHSMAIFSNLDALVSDEGL